MNVWGKEEVIIVHHMHFAQTQIQVLIVLANLALMEMALIVMVKPKFYHY